MEESRIFTPGKVHPEEDYEKLAALSAKLGIPFPQMHFTISVTQDGKTVEVMRRRSRTWNRNFWNYVMCHMTSSPSVITNFGAGYLSFKNTAGAVAAIAAEAVNFTKTGAINNSSYGIQIGRGAGAEDFEGSVMSTLITHGTGANQMSYAAHSALVQAYTSGSKLWTITIKRVFTNTSTASITVTEIGWTWLYNAETTYRMMNRDLLGAGVAVANNASITVTYDVTLTFPA